MSSCNHCGRWTDNTKLGEDCKYCKEVYAQGLADGMRRRENEILQLRELLKQIEWVSDSGFEFTKFCPKCEDKMPEHDPDCTLDAAIKGNLK